MSSIADLTSRPVPLKVEVRDDRGEPTGEVLEYLVYPLNFADQGDLQRWIDSQFPDPYDAAWSAINRQRDKGKPFNFAQEKLILQIAGEQAMKPRNLIGTPEADKLLTSLEGLKQIILIGIRKGKPDFADADADRLIQHMNQADIVRTYAATQISMVLDDPKAEPLDVKPKTRPNGSSTSRRTRRAATAKRRSGG
jgi:hypothetical protein